MRDIQLRPRAQLDLESIYLYLAMAQAAPQAAERVAAKLYESMERLAEFPELGSLVKDSGLERDYRRMLSGSYWLYYTHDDERLTVWRIFHARQDIDDFTLVDL